MNVIFSGILIYGVATRSPRYILPWILISMATNVFTLLIAICTNFGLIPGFSLGANWLCMLAELLRSRIVGRNLVLVVACYFGQQPIFGGFGTLVKASKKWNYGRKV